ncbi:N-acetyl-gamma-glutamyl-phosphate reductase [Robiginitalea sp. IMCC43444]|uniref:N-acetyl-gamma-glutamyl-phosphate reductase n=1 Tax=Robiginitalea sp. IMCC43444 TaxID=3459121 RepID=UPI0040432781
MITAGIIGGSGYTGGELIRLLVHHPEASLKFVYSTTRAGKPLSSAHADLLGQTDLLFTDRPNPDVDVVFLCLGHGNSKEFLKGMKFSDKTRIIDLSNDFRLAADQHFQGMDFVYGLPELNKERIKKTQYLANPGCFATAIQLSLLPLASSGLLQDSIHVHALTGSTGAGVSPSETTHFSWRDNNVSWYKPFTHQHLGEINESLKSLQPDAANLLFLPIRGNFSRGIFSTATTRVKAPLEAIRKMYEDYYKDAPFTHVSGAPLHLKAVVNSNQAYLHLLIYEDQLLVTAVIDNLLKGASGQAVQNMNLMFGLNEAAGLQLKASAF